MVRRIEFPRIVLAGHGCIDQVGPVSLEVSQGKNVLIVTGDKTKKVAGDKVASLMRGSGFNVSTHITEKATQESVEQAAGIVKKDKVNLVIGVGGGTCIDVAKVSSFQQKVPFISVPTAASHDGVGSPIASIKNKGKKQASQITSTPIAIIADTKIISTAPRRLMAAGCGDIVSNYTAVEDWKLAHKLKGVLFMDYAAALSIMSAQVILDSANIIAEYSEESAKTVIEGLISSGAAMCIAGSSRPCSGAEHLFSHALDRIAPKPALHGEQCGLGAIMMAYLHKLDWGRFKHVLELVGAPTTAKELGVEDKHIIEALAMAHTIRDRYTILGENGLSKKKAEKVARATQVIG